MMIVPRVYLMILARQFSTTFFFVLNIKTCRCRRRRLRNKREKIPDLSGFQTCLEIPKQPSLMRSNTFDYLFYFIFFALLFRVSTKKQHFTLLCKIFIV